MSIIDVRSDIITQPSESMLQAMIETGKRPRQYGYREDQDLKTLERLVADTFEKEDAIFLPTCTMANQIALMIRCRRGSNLLVDAKAHINNYEASSTIGIAGVIPRIVDDHHGHPTPKTLEATLYTYDTSLVWWENTHNRAGGTVLNIEQQNDLIEICKNKGIPTHVDGARIWNAATALGCSVADLTRGIDSVSASLNKGLGVPLGAVLAGTKKFIDKAAQLQITLGGGWRPTGMIAAAGVIALENLANNGLAEDHKCARTVATAIAKYDWIDIDLERVQTNIVMVKLRSNVQINLQTELQQRGILANMADHNTVRLVFYRQIRDAEVKQILTAFADINKSIF